MSGRTANQFDLFAHDQYFVRRDDSEDQLDFEEDYWGKVKDPDGVERDRFGPVERQKHIANLRDEIDHISARCPGRVLDIGCGAGFLLSALPEGWEKHGVEISGFAAKHAATFGKIHHGTLAEAGYPTSHFDVVVLHHVIEHVKDPFALIGEIRRVLADDGSLVLGTPNFDSGCARRFGERYRLLHDRTHVTLFSDESMRRFLTHNGFVIDRAEYPYFDTEYFTEKNLLRLFDTSTVSPPFYGNFMTFYCRKMKSEEAVQMIEHTIRAMIPLVDAKGGTAGELESLVRHVMGKCPSQSND